MVLNSKKAQEILISASTSSEAILKLYHAYKLLNQRVSINFLCQKSGIPSKGYLSDVMHGKKRLVSSYAAGLAKAFGLKGLEAKYFRYLVEADHASNDQQRRTLNSRLEAVRKAFSVTVQPMPSGLDFDAFVFEVFCAFGLFKGTPTREDLEAYFGKLRRQEISKSLLILLGQGFISEVDGRYSLLKDHVSFTGGDARRQHLDFLRKAIYDAAAKTEIWFDEQDLSYFESTLISVKTSDYALSLAQLRDDVLQWQTNVESCEADTLIRFNVQIYPVSEVNLKGHNKTSS